MRAAERVAHDVRPRDVEMVRQRQHITRHRSDVIVLRIVELCRLPVPAIVERDHAPARLAQMRYPGRIDPVHVLGGGKAVHEDDRIALAFVEIGNLDPGIVEIRHEISLISCWRRVLRP